LPPPYGAKLEQIINQYITSREHAVMDKRQATSCCALAKTFSG
jgi:hypothetical protein